MQSYIAIMMNFYQCNECDQFHVRGYQGDCNDQFFTVGQLGLDDQNCALVSPNCECGHSALSHFDDGCSSSVCDCDKIYPND